MRNYLQSEVIERYPEARHGFDPKRASRWAHKAFRSLDRGGLIPSAAAMANEVRAHAGAPLAVVSLLEGIAAGTMLTTIAETMMPEAYFKGGSIVGLSTPSGFLVADFFTTLE